VIKEVVSTVPGITTNHVQATSTETRIKVEEPRTVYDILDDICSQNDWIFFVDNSGDLWAFQRGYYTTSEDLSNVEIYEMEYVEDPDHIINYQAVFGERDKILGGDSDWTEDIDCDTCLWEVSGQSGSTTSISLVSDAISPDDKVGYGTYAIRGRVSDADIEGPSLTITFREGGTATSLDLSYFGTLEFSVLYRFLSMIKNSEESLRLQIQFITSTDNYYQYVVEVPGVDIKKRCWNAGIIYDHFYGWHRYKMNFNILKGSEVEIVGTPTFESISKIKFTVLSPLPTQTGNVDLYIDYLQFTNGLHFGESSDTTSINTYGRRDGKIVYDKSLESDTACQNIADKIVQTYKDPIYSFEYISTSGIFSLTPGYEMELYLSDWRDNRDLRTNLSLSSRYVPSLERILAGITRDVDRLTKEDLIENIPDTGLFRYGPPGLDPSDIDDTPFGHDNVIRNPYFLITDRLYEPNAVVPAQWSPNTVPVGAEYISTTEGKVGGQCLHITNGVTISSWYFPVLPRDVSEDPDFYRVGLWTKSEQSTGASLDVNLVYFTGSGVAATINVWDPFEGDGTWQYKETIVPMNKNAVGAFLELGVNTGHGYYVDDVIL